MQKINVISVVRWHLDTLRADSGNLSKVDLLTFYALPIFVGCGFYAFNWNVSNQAVELSVTVFSIFAALLLSVQVALYNVSLRPLSPPNDPKERTAYESYSSIRKTVLRELNDNVAYLILLAILWLTVLLVLYVGKLHGRLPSAFVIAMYVHFFLTLLMVVKRASIVFSREYEG